MKLLAVAALLALAGCAAGPDYRKPEVAMPVDWKVEAPFRAGTPNDTAPKGSWWLRFGDAQLDTLVAKAIADSPTLAVARARLDQARATVAGAEAALYPQLGLTSRSSRLRISANRPLTNYNAPNFTTTQDDFVLQLTASYEADVSGRIGRTIEGALASVEQSTADLANAQLLLVADLASAYFNLRQTDVELDVITRAIELQKRAFGLVNARRELGAASGLDLAQQQALLDATLAQVDVLRRLRAQYEHAIATLTGTPAPQFSLAPAIRELSPPAVPIGVPSDLLERRPDVAAAERAMAAANAQIGVASAAFYPSVPLGAAYGFESRTLGTLFSAPSILWSLGVSLLQPLFDGGRIQANVDFATAGYNATVGNYRRVVLTAMQEVEDGIIGMAALERAHSQARIAVASAGKVLDLATARYEGGVATYLDVITAQQSLLNAERQAAQLMGQRLLVSVFLVKALGGDWQGLAAPASRDPGGIAPQSARGRRLPIA